MNPEDPANSIPSTSEGPQVDQQPVVTTQPTQPASEPKGDEPKQSQEIEKPKVDEETTYKKRYEDSKQKYEKDYKPKLDTLELIDKTFIENPEAYDIFRENFKKINGIDPGDYEAIYGRERPQKGDQPINQDQPVSTNTGIDPSQLNTLVSEALDRKEKNKSAFGQYFEVHPEMDPSKYSPDSEEYKQNAELESKILAVANTLMSTTRMEGGKALILAHDVITGNEEEKLTQAKNQGMYEGYTRGIQNGVSSNAPVSSGTQRTSTGLVVTAQDRAIAARSRTGTTPEDVAKLRERGLIS